MVNFDVFLKNNNFYIFNSKPYILTKERFILCSFENLSNLQDPNLSNLNEKSFKFLLKEIILQNSEKIINEELFVFFKNSLVHLQTLEVFSELNNRRGGFLTFDFNFKKFNDLKFIKMSPFFNNFDNSNIFISSLRFFYQSSSYFSFGIQMRNSCISSFNSFFQRFSGNQFIFINEPKDINTDLLYDKNVIRIPSTIMESPECKKLLERNIINLGKINTQPMIFTGNIIIYFPLNRAISKRRKKNLNNQCLKFKGDSFDISYFEEEFDLFNYLILRSFIKFKTFDSNIVSSFKKDKVYIGKITSSWIEQQVIKSSKSKNYVQARRIYNSFSSFCKIRGFKPPSKSIFNFLIKKCENKFFSEEDNIIKNNNSL